MNVKELKKQAKTRGLKGYSSLGKSALVNLLALDDKGQAPNKNLTAKRKKELKNVKKSGLTLEEEENYTDNPAFGVEGPARPSVKTLKISAKKTKGPKIPKRPSKASIIKKVKAKKKKECAKYANLNKKSVPQLISLL